MIPEVLENTPELWQVPKPQTDGHKYDRGHTAILAGEMSGAPRIAARCARRVGSGLVTLAGPEDIYPILATEEAGALLHHLDTKEDLAKLLSNNKITTWLIGMGYGVHEETCLTVCNILETNKPTVLDADAITSFKNNSKTLFSAIHEDVILTPHAGEFHTLFPHLTVDKLLSAQEAAKLSGAVIVLKGSHTIIAAPDGKTAINTNAPPTLATAGSGDALAGIIAGLLAQGMNTFDASACGVYLHAETANMFGEGLIAEDISDMLPQVLRSLTSINSPIKIWLDAMQSIWLNKNPNNIADILSKNLEYFESPFEAPLTSIQEVVNVWQEVKNQHIDYVKIEILDENNDTGTALWKFKEIDKKEHIGMYFIKLDSTGKCKYFRQCWNSK